MKSVLGICLLLCVLTGCEVEIDVASPDMGPTQAARIEYPTVNLPVALRQANWTGRNGEGSCVHATVVNLFRWQGRNAKADDWRAKYGDGEVADQEWQDALGLSDNLTAKFDREGVRYAYCTDGDVSFLEWACRTRRGCGVTVMGGKHMVALVHFDDQVAGILDNNDIEHIIWVSREQFVSEWQNSNGWAVTPVYTPAPPLP